MKKKIYGYGLMIIVVILLAVLFVRVTEKKSREEINTYKVAVEKSENELRRLEKELELAKEEKEKEEEKPETDYSNLGAQAEMERHYQIMNDLTEIYNLIDEGKTAEAAEKFGVIETIGFDDGELAFYEALKKLLNA